MYIKGEESLRLIFTEPRISIMYWLYNQPNIYITNSIQQSPWQAKRSTDVLEIPHNYPPLVPVRSQNNRVYKPLILFLEDFFNIILLQHRYKQRELRVILGFRHDVNEICALLWYYAAYSRIYLLTFQCNLSVSFSRVTISWSSQSIIFLLWNKNLPILEREICLI